MNTDPQPFEELKPHPETDVAAGVVAGRRRRWHIWLISFLLLGLTAAFVFWLWLRSGNLGEGLNVPAVAVLEKPKDPQVRSEDEMAREKLIGRWQRESYYGQSLLTLHPDGTGTMEIDFNLAFRFTVAKRLEIQIAWQVNKGRVVFDSLKGDPVAAFQMVSKAKGTRRDQKIERITAEEAVFINDQRDGKTQIWKRLFEKVEP